MNGELSLLDFRATAESYSFAQYINNPDINM
jgi:hypothetical protein